MSRQPIATRRIYGRKSMFTRRSTSPIWRQMKQDATPAAARATPSPVSRRRRNPAWYESRCRALAGRGMP